MLKIFIKKNLTVSLIIFLSLLAIILNFFRFFKNNAVYQFDPWLSNYQGGFVRRGLPGEIFFQLNEILNLHPGWFAFIFVCFLYIFFYFIFFNLIKEIKLNKTFIFCFFSPLAFYFPVLNSKASGHKEILFLFFLALFCFLLPKLKSQHANYLMLIVSIFVTLSYEVLVFYLPYLVIAFILFSNFNDMKKLFLNLVPIIIVFFFLVFINYIFKGTESHVHEICNSIKLYVNPLCNEVGKIADLKLSLSDHTSQKGQWNYGQASLYSSYLKIYLTGFVIGFLPLAILSWKSKISQKINIFKYNPIFFLIIPFSSTLPVYYFGADWGRYLYISYMSSLILFIFCFKNEIFINYDSIKIFKINKISKFIFILCVTIYGFAWTVPICCENKFKLGISTVIERVFYYYNKES